MSHFVKKHFGNLEELLKAQSKLCQSSVPAYDIGFNREFFVREVLRTHLPPFCEITSGSICDDTEEPSGQIDIILFHPLTLRVNIGATECCISESVFAALEVKSQLTEDHFKASIKNLAKVRRLSRAHLYTPIRGATWSSSAYHFNTLATVLFGFRGYGPETCVQKIHAILGEGWEKRPEAVYSLDEPYLLVRNDYLKYEGEGVHQVTGPMWIEKLDHESANGYLLIRKECLLVLMTLLSLRIQSNYHLLPMLHNYLGDPHKESTNT